MLKLGQSLQTYPDANLPAPTRISWNSYTILSLFFVIVAAQRPQSALAAAAIVVVGVRARAGFGTFKVQVKPMM